MKTSRFIKYVVNLPGSDFHAGMTCVRIWDDVAKRDIRLSDFAFEPEVASARPAVCTTPRTAETGWKLGNVIDIGL